jgi:2-polyprenyl-3-methyl-5-hydroxy-6-metoxy-1,4-benzoquinol methylase
MDLPGLDPATHRHALRGLTRINRLSMPGRDIWRAVRPMLSPGGPPLRLLDLATGGGDLALALARRARDAKLPLICEGCDMSDEAIAFAEERAQAEGLDVAFFRRDLEAEGMAEGYDVAVSGLFFHHLERESATALLASMAARARRLVAISDLVRSPWGLAAAYVGTRLLSRSHVVHADGPQSVRAAFTPEEFARIADRAGLEGYRIRRRWPFRFLFTWRRDDGRP